MYKIKQWLYTFMQGRYGPDQLYRFLFGAFIVLLVLSLFIHSPILVLLQWALLIYTMFRLFSRNTVKRAAENRKYLAIRDTVVKSVKRTFNRVRDIKTKRYRKCPHCGTWVRLPVKKGTHPVNCPNCRERFEVTIRF